MHRCTPGQIDWQAIDERGMLVGSRSSARALLPFSIAAGPLPSAFRTKGAFGLEVKMAGKSSEFRQEALPTPKPSRLIPLSHIASAFGLPETSVADLIDGRKHRVSARQEFYSIDELAERWRCSRGTVYNRLRGAGAKVLDFSAPGKRSRKAVSANTILEIENRRTKRLA
jgi:hypothetical protein